MASSLSLMNSFEQQYAVLTAEITSKISYLSNVTRSEKRQLVSQVDRQMEEAQELLEQMDLEIRGMTQAARQKYQIRLKSYINELALLNKELKSRVDSNDEFSTREDLFDGGYGMKDEQKQRLLDNTETLDRSTRQLQSGYKIAVETEQIGAQILSDLHSQKETIKKARERVGETNEDLGKSSRILSRMIRGLLQQRALLTLVGMVILISIIVGIYFIAKRS